MIRSCIAKRIYLSNPVGGPAICPNYIRPAGPGSTDNPVFCQPDPSLGIGTDSPLAGAMPQRVYARNTRFDSNFRVVFTLSARLSRSPVERHFVVFQRPFLHIAHARWNDPVNNQRGIIYGTKVVTQEWIGIPNLLQERAIHQYFGQTGDSHLVVLVVQITKFDLWIGRNLDRFVVIAQIGDINR